MEDFHGGNSWPCLRGWRCVADEAARLQHVSSLRRGGNAPRVRPVRHHWLHGHQEADPNHLALGVLAAALRGELHHRVCQRRVRARGGAEGVVLHRGCLDRVHFSSASVRQRLAGEAREDGVPSRGGVLHGRAPRARRHHRRHLAHRRARRGRSWGVPPQTRGREQRKAGFVPPPLRPGRVLALFGGRVRRARGHLQPDWVQEVWGGHLHGVLRHGPAHQRVFVRRVWGLRLGSPAGVCVPLTGCRGGA
mmetsp:Transcript_25617/g.52542  ORF Transcript_25617/g.52542 Transcript_25617/m.52542 type:complete len:249 (-) Transcript_25617:2087-2833(-)